MSLLERPTGSGDDEATAAAERRVRMRSARRWEVRERRKEKEYPPPIPSLARTENLHSRMPWVLTRTYTADGRLILREEPVSHHEYFRAHRRDGRLTLQLVPLDDEVVFDLEDAEPEPEADTAPSCVGDNDNDTRDDNYLQCPEAEGDDAGCNESMTDHREPVLAAVAEMGGGVGKCLKGYDISGGSSSCIFGVAVPALRPVHG